MKNKKTDILEFSNIEAAIKMAEREIKEWTLFLEQAKIRLAKKLNKK